MLQLARRKLIKLAAPALMLPGRLKAQGGMMPGPGTVHSTGGGGFTFLQSVKGSGQNTFTTSAASFTGVDLIVAAYTTGGAASVLSDNQSNTYTQVGSTVTNGGGKKTSMYFKQAPTVSGSMTFTLTASSQFANLIVFGFSGSIASPLDQNSSNNNTGNTTIQLSPSVTPGHINELIVTCLGTDDTAGTTGYTISASGGTYLSPTNWVVAQSGSNQGGAMVYTIQTTATAAQPTWTDPAASVSSLNAILGTFRSV